MSKILVTKDDFKRFEECLKKAMILKNKENFQLTEEFIKQKKISVFFNLSFGSSASKIDEADFIDENEMEFNNLNYADIKIFDDDVWFDEGINFSEDSSKIVNSEFNIELAPYPGETIKDGQDVGLAAQQYYRSIYQNCKNLDLYGYQIAQEKTKHYLLDSKIDVYFEPTFVYDNCITKCDILIRDRNNRNAFHLVEVKASSAFKKDKTGEYVLKNIRNEYLRDVAYQYYVLTKNNLEIKSVSLMFLNNIYYREGDIDYDQLFTINNLYKSRNIEKPLIEYCQEQIENIAIKINNLSVIFNKPNNNLLDILTSDNCLNGESDNKNYCSHVSSYVPPKNSVFNLYKGREKKSELFYRYRIVNLSDIPIPFIFPKKTKSSKERTFNIWQLRQIKYLKNEEGVFDLSKINDINNEILRYKLPVYMYDFETMKSAIPIFDYSNSYQQIPFQYSVHTINNFNFNYHIDKIEQSEYLSDGEMDPRLELIKHLIKDLYKYGKGTYVAYYKSFECTRIKEMILYLTRLMQNKDFEIYRGEFCRYQEQLKYIADNTLDLMDFFHEFQIYKDGFNGSISIKKTLPAFQPDFTYDNLKIRKGDMASETFRRRVENNIPLPIWKQFFKVPMLQYCCQDTLAMVAVFQSIITEFRDFLLINNERIDDKNEWIKKKKN